jgi:hypothetical protein
VAKLPPGGSREATLTGRAAQPGGPGRQDVFPAAERNRGRRSRHHQHRDGKDLCRPDKRSDRPVCGQGPKWRTLTSQGGQPPGHVPARQRAGREAATAHLPQRCIRCGVRTEGTPEAAAALADSLVSGNGALTPCSPMRPSAALPVFAWGLG